MEQSLCNNMLNRSKSKQQGTTTPDNAFNNACLPAQATWNKNCVLKQWKFT